MVNWVQKGERFELTDPTVMPRAAGFLWNRKMLLQVSCRGYAVAQFMQPEPAKYAYAPNLEAKTFMQPEQPYYAHHPGRFFYVKDEETGALFSAPYEPVRAKLDRFCFSVGKSDLRWSVQKDGIALDLSVTLPTDDAVELWKITLSNLSNRPRRLSFYVYFPVGYMSWMNQSARYRPDLVGIVASCVTPYQKVADYFKNKHFKDRTFLLAAHAPVAWDARQEAFEGEGGLHDPDGVRRAELSKSDAVYETPTAALQYRIELAPGQGAQHRFVFGPAFDETEIVAVREKFLHPEGFARAAAAYQAYLAEGEGCLQIETPDPHFDNFVNHWLPRQVFYLGDVNRLTTDPQTRNYLQDNMGMSYLQPRVARAAFLRALSQQEPGGAMPDGILLVEGAELKYINQVPHTDHCVWLPICLQAYLDETGDYGILREAVADRRGDARSVFERITSAMRWLLAARDERGLCYIGQGDWCDPMNMVGYKGKGVSGWLSLATAYALKLWADICREQRAEAVAHEFQANAETLNRAVNQHLWDGRWFGRGITDEGVVFGGNQDREGRIFLNPQSWAILSGAADAQQRKLMLEAIAEHLETPYGAMLLAPPFTRMREDIGRVTHKFPGSAENGSVYNHGAAFYAYALYAVGDADRAFRILRQMIPGPDLTDFQQRGQLPTFLPNYYRGAYREYPSTAGRSSQLFNTGTAAWFYRCLIDGLFGLKGEHDSLLVRPMLPSSWARVKLMRKFRGATINVNIGRGDVTAAEVMANGRQLPGGRLNAIQPGRSYHLEVTLAR
jgi:cellobionic acid phosphorylase